MHYGLRSTRIPVEMVTTRSQAAAMKAAVARARAIEIQRERLHALIQRLTARRTKHTTNQPTQRKRRPFALMLLPAEIRVMIYAFTFTVPEPVYLVTCKLPALACTSRELQDETIPVFLKISKFHTSSSIALSNLYTRSWLRRVSLNVPSIRTVTFKPPNESETLPPHAGIRIVATKDRPQISHHDMQCPFCIPITISCMSWWEVPVLPPRLRYNLHISKKRHDDALDTWARRELPEHTAQGFSISQIIRLADAVATIPECSSPELMVLMQESIDAVKAYIKRVNPLSQYLIDEET